MANNTFQLNYEEMTSIAKKFKDNGEDVVRLHSETRQRVRDLHKEWIGEAAEKFFEEMETELLPALQRLSLALFQTQDVSNEIMKIIQGADEETAGYFKDQLSGDDFGAGRFGAALNDLQSGGEADDFGAGKFGEVVGTPADGGTSSSDDFGASKFGEATPGQPGHESTSNEPGSAQQHNTNSSQDGGGGSDKHQKDQPAETPTDTKPTSGGGGGGSTSSSTQGLQGDLKNMGAGLSDVAQQNAESGIGPGGGSSTDMPDHIYSDSGASNTGGTQPQPTEIASGNTDQPAPSGGGAAAGVAGSVGVAAAGGAAKLIKEQKNKTSE